MVNRRLLRVKAFQQMYAYWTQERAQHYLAFDGLAAIFQPDLSLMIAKEDQTPRLEGLRKLAEIQLTEFFQGIPTEETIPAEALEAAQSVHRTYKNNIAKIAKELKKEMVVEVESIFKQYLKLLYYIQALPMIGQWDEQRRLLENPIKTSLIGKNKVLAIMPKWRDLQQAFADNNIGWSEDEENMLKKVFIEGILPDEAFSNYLPNAGKDVSADIEMIKYILKNYLLKHPIMAEFFEEKDLNWHLNKDVVKSLATKTFKVDALEDLQIQPLGLQWEDDKKFFEELFDYCIKEDIQLTQWVNDQTKNWETERLATTDLIILKMAVAEMIQFASIPVKVSINEFIEVAKNYSTPKSGSFINGILDVISVRLISEKIIQKSGRGLIDIASK
ncbi:transcription antitermination factor NusB [Aquirufa sp.]|jgi:N utilization substance protein B|uniref:transcription antitermination factor NusB n=1 Tax=Aquirufa sp. TaxID=2676249 RepID=UPI0037BE281A